MPLSRTKSWFPTTSSPLIVSAPMAFVANVQLATEVTKAGGLGFIQGGRDFSVGSADLKNLDSELTSAHEALEGFQDWKLALPIGVGFVAYSPSISQFAETAVPILRRHRPAAVWIFAPSPHLPNTVAGVIESLRNFGDEWGLRVVVQVGSVAAAREAAQDGADIIVAQGTDAGGHQWAHGASFISLVPEIADMVAEEFSDREISVWAAGGMADGRGVAAAIALGAEAAVLGTRFVAAVESSAQDFKRNAITSTSDGGANTVKSQLHDHVQGNKEWPDIYDGRAILHPSYQDDKAGVPLEDNTERFKSAKDAGDNSRMITWSGTGVGLIKEVLPAADIVRVVREGAIKAIAGAKSAA
ncbi:hypothetical protein JX265_007055 [Neoarthrinium moseri]|uniref:Nitronate monooxygenase domain-containing protein n=1 Tax=Neoarthrinium moseri TaxID=1658444 RepID=A0A9P9WKG2_9PEZI|nr:hypothetical protein JX265_007055 [Neoarthrinium moseri]